MVTQAREMSDRVFLSLSEETKIKMHNQQFFIDSNDDWSTINEWIGENAMEPYHLEVDSGGKNGKTRRWVFFYDAADAAAFKLRWL